MRKLICCIFLALSLAAAHAEDKGDPLFNRCGPVGMVGAVSDDLKRLSDGGATDELVLVLVKTVLSASRIPYEAGRYPEVLATVDTLNPALGVDTDDGFGRLIFSSHIYFRKMLTDSHGNEMVGSVYHIRGYRVLEREDRDFDKRGKDIDDYYEWGYERGQAIGNAVGKVLTDGLREFVRDYLKANEGYCK